MSIHIQNISKKFGQFTALDNVSLEVASGELMALLGPSGSGKTTLLRIIAGLEKADAGEVRMEAGATLNATSVRDRKVGFVFQHYALFRHMTVLENVAFGLRVRERSERLSEIEIRRKVRRLLELVHLDTFQDRYPSQLSGGQRQRVALARALAVEPKVLLLDEPFGALDAKVRKELRRFMRRLHEEMSITSIFVTHDQEEAMEVADRVVVMSQGRIEQVGTPTDVWQHPENAFVYDFLGNYNEFDGWKDEAGTVHLAETEVLDMPEQKIVPTQGWLNRHPEIGSLLGKILPGIAGEVAVSSSPGIPAVSKPAGGKTVKIYARPHEMWVTKTPDDKEYIRARVIHINPAGPVAKLELERLNGEVLQAEIPGTVLEHCAIARNDLLYLRPTRMRVFG